MNLPAYIEHKVFQAQLLKEQVRKWKEQGETVVFTNGCFDILHPGHVDYLIKAAEKGTKLIVAVNTDQSVRKLKGDSRPLNNEMSRMFVLGGLACVDALVLFGEDTPLDIIKLLEPDVLVKGGDYDENESDETSPKYIVGSKEVKQHGGKVMTIPFLEGFSTTGLIDKISDRG